MTALKTLDSTRLLTIFAVFVTFATFAACQSSDEPEQSESCDGMVEEIDGRSYCVHSKSEITETGFDCPSTHPHQHDYDDMVVCSKKDRNIPEDHEKQIREQHDEIDDIDGKHTIDTGIDRNPDTRIDLDTGVPDDTSETGRDTAPIGEDTPDGGTRQFVSSGTLQFKQISSGLRFACGVTTADEVLCWGGDNLHGQTDAPDGTFKQVSAGPEGERACAVSTDEGLECWGEDIPNLPSDVGFAYVNVGKPICAVTTDNELRCWGISQNYGSDADGGSTTGSDADAGSGDTGIGGIAPTGKYTQVSTASVSSVCAVTTNDSLKCWPDRNAAPSGSFQQVSVGNQGGAVYVCGLTVDDDVRCRRTGEGDGPSEGTIQGPFAQFSCGDSYDAPCCAVRADGSAVECWYPYVDDTTVDPPGGELEQVSVGAGFACALRTDGIVVCWGTQEHTGLESPPNPPTSN